MGYGILQKKAGFSYDITLAITPDMTYNSDRLFKEEYL